MRVTGLFSSALFCSTALAIGQKSTINFNSTGLQLAEGGSSVQLYADGHDWPGVLRVVDDLAADFGLVTGTNGTVTLLGNGTSPSLNTSTTFNVTGKTGFGSSGSGKNNRKGGAIIAGTIGNSSIIDRLISEGKVDVSDVEGNWEAYVSTVVENPVQGVSRAVVIAGADKRGTIYGLYSISEQIGVSPWYFWADSPPQQHSSIHAQDVTVVQKTPSVRYRGIFLNDEAPALTGYVKAKFPDSPWGPGYNAEFYATVFELLLRLRANYLWPAMWNSMFNVDDPRTQPLADEYGIVMGTSHTEPMMRSTKEWSQFGNGTWSWETNNETIYPFFVEGAERAAPYESVVTMGMRGYHDTPIGPTNDIALLEAIVEAQTEILTDIWGTEAVRDPEIVPQTWCLYKEVQGYIDAGMQVPDYITLLWADDNFGNIRRLPRGNETERSGGAGVYYHFDYVGDPRSYKWINTAKLQKTWEQMHMAYERNAREIWVVNVGDLKPLEVPISHMMDLAYDIDLWDKNSVPTWLRYWASREFGPSVAAQTAELMNNYTKTVGRRKYELTDITTYNIINYEEADRVLATWENMAKVAESIYESLPEATQAAFFEMVYHPVTAGYVYHDIMISTAKNNLYAGQGRNSANALADHVREQFDRDHELSAEYNSILDGKWEHMMDQTHIGYRYWQQPMRQVLPGLQYVQTKERALTGDMGVTTESSNATVPGDDPYHDNGSNSLTMQPFDPYGASSRWIEIFVVGTQEFDWNITANASFVSFSQSSGTLSPDGETDVRVYVTVDFDQAPEGSGMVQLNVSSSTDYGAQFNMPILMLPYTHTSVPDSFSGHVESDRHVSIEAEHWTSVTNSSSARYEVVTGLSRTLSGVTLFPVTAPSFTTSNAPGLSYDFYTFSGSVAANLTNITVVMTPNLNTIPDRPLRYAIQLDDQDVRIVQPVVDQPNGANPLNWGTAVANNAWLGKSNFTYTGPGAHTLKLWALEPGLVFNSVWVDLGGIKPSYLGPPESARV
ncbi:hypothetical protein Q7P37_004414 [Cladosporium fusiforme]